MTLRHAAEFIELQEAVAGRFSLEREIGRGGMGIVFMARDVRLERQVAIKLLAPALAARAGMRRKFLREARIAAQCFHPHIVPIHEVEEQDSLAWFVMSWVRGETLAQRVSRTGAQPPELVRRIGREMGWALAYAHERGVVHRDIKPENILLEQGTDRSLLTDFGIALRDDVESTSPTGEVAGTASYMAPEQALGERVDGRADLYALGATLFVAATGRPPFTGQSSLALIVQHATQTASPVQELAPSLPTTVADAIDRCLAKRADDRFPTANDFVAMLDSTTAPAVLTPAALHVQSAARAAESILGWSATIGITTALLIIGESSGFGRSLIGGMGSSITTLLAAASLLRIGETLLATRRALATGSGADEVADALSGMDAVRNNASRSRTMGVTAAASGILLALAQGAISEMTLNLSDAMTMLVQVGFLVVPPFLIGRGGFEALADTTVSRWLRRRLFVPVSRSIVRSFGAFPAEHQERDARLAASPTEVVLDIAAHELFDELPAAVRADLASLPDAIAALARDADQLRHADRALADAERAARAAGHGIDDAELMGVMAQREVVRQRLSTAIAALEGIRIDLMRLATGAVDASQLTSHLQVARDLEHRLAADAEVRDLLARPYTAGAST